MRRPREERDRPVLLDDAIAALYEAFSKYRLRAGIEQCNCGACTRVDENSLRSPSLRHMPLHRLEVVGRRVMTTWGDVDDFRHLLPRFLELLAESDFSDGASLDPELMGCKLTYGRWKSWPKAEVRAVADFLKAYWTDRLARPPELYNQDTPLSVLVSAGLDIAPALEQWRASLDSPAAVRLYEYLSSSSARQVLKGEPPPYWDAAPESVRVFGNWLLSDHLFDAVENAAPITTNAEFAEALQHSRNLLFGMRLDCGRRSGPG